MDNLLNPNLIHYSFNQIVINLIAAAFLGTITAFFYKRTHQGVSYSQSFVNSLVLIAIITSTAIMVIGNSLTRAFGLIGAFSVIRFRTAVKDTRDVAFLFFSLVEGLAAGTGNYQIALIALVVFLLTVIILTRGKFGKYTGFDYLLSFQSSAKTKDKKAPYLELFKQYLADHMLLSLRSTANDSQISTAYNIRFKDDTQAKPFLSQLKKVGVTDIELLSSQNDVDY